MPAYYFHIRDNGQLLRDPDGLELADLGAARIECEKLIISVLQEQQITEYFSGNREFVVEDDTGKIVLIVPFSMALRQAPVRDRRLIP